MKSKNIQSVDETLYSYNSINYDQSTLEFIEYSKDNFFKFGSATLAVVYMVNTMLIPNMNQLFIDINFENPLKMIISVVIYWLISFLILIPCYLVIKLCRREGNPIFAYILKDDCNKQYHIFIYCNLIINTLGLYNILVRLGDSIPKINRQFYQEFSTLLNSNQGFYSYLTILSYTIVVLGLFFILYKISYFEHYYDIQYRLLFSFIGKIILNAIIFYLVYIEVTDCSKEYISTDENLYNLNFKEGISPWISFGFSVICCISYPFFEVFYVKRETKQGYLKVQSCYWIQLLIRSLIFFYQVVTWGIIIKQNKMNCYYQPLLQSLNSLLILLIAISICPIYSHNYTLNKEILNNTIYTATEQDNKKQIKEVYLIASGIFVGQMIICVIFRIFVENSQFIAVKQLIYSLTYSVQTICFCFSCIGIPVYLWLKQKQHKKLAYIMLFICMLIFIIISSSPLVTL